MSLLSDTLGSYCAHELQQVSGRSTVVTQAGPSKGQLTTATTSSFWAHQTDSATPHMCTHTSALLPPQLLCHDLFFGAKKGRALLLPEANCFKCSLCHSSGLLNLRSLEVESHVLQPEDGAVGTAQHQAIKVICWLWLSAGVHQSCL